MQRFAFVAVVALLGGVVGSGVVHAWSGSSDPGPYTACVNAKNGNIRMVGSITQCSKNEYGIEWQQPQSAYPISNFSVQYGGEADFTGSGWFQQLACPAGTRAGGAAIGGEEDFFALRSSIPSNMEDESGNSSGWEVGFTTVDGAPHTADFQIYAVCGDVEVS